MDQTPKLLDRLPRLPPRPSSKTNLPAQGAKAKDGKEKEEAAKTRLTARLEAMSAESLEPPAVDPRTAAVAALMVANFISDDAVRRCFLPLASAKLFDLNALDDLPVAARFVLRILPKLGPELDQREALPKASLLGQIKFTKEEMLRTAERHLLDTDEAHGRLVSIRMGTTAADDVYDLRMLADLWRDYGETLASEAGAAFRPDTEREARELANHLERALLGPLSEEEAEWRSYLHRALGMLVPLYDEVCRAGRFLFHDNKPEARFPSLASVARVRRRLKRETARRDSHSGLRVSVPPTSTRASLPPEAAFVDVSDKHEEALAEAMTSVPPAPPNLGAPPVAALPRSPRTPAPLVAPRPSPRAAVPIALAAPPSGDEEDVPLSFPESAKPTLRSEVVSFDPLEVVRLDFSPTASAGEDADSDLETPDLDLELTYMSESNFYSDVAGNVLGLFVATFVVKVPGTPIAVRLSLPQLDDPFFVSGEVQWVREFSPSIEAPPGMGVALKALGAEERRAADAFMRIRPPILHDDG